MNRYKATIILIIVTIGYLISGPFHKTFWGGLISSGFCASMIGGFADWYGITALFRKPLGVPYKTEIIPKNREKIFDGLSDMVSEELLSKAYLKKLLSKHDTSKVILDFVANDSGRETIIAVAALIMEQGLENINSDEIGSMASGLVSDNLSKFDMWKVIEASIEMSVENGYDDKIINFIIEEILLVLEDDDFDSILTELIDNAKSSYESGKASRAIVNTVVLDFILNLSSEKIAVVVKQKILDYLTNIKNEDNNEDREKLKKWLYAKLYSILYDKNIQQKFDKFKQNQINAIDISGYMSNLFEKLKDEIDEENGNKLVGKITTFMENQLDNIVNKFKDSKVIQGKVDSYIKKSLYRLIDNSHDSLRKLIRGNLDKYSDEMLVNLIESKAGNDLQLIRINGSVVGGLVGIVLFLLSQM